MYEVKRRVLLVRYFAEKRRVVEKGATLLELVAQSIRVEKDIRDRSFGACSITSCIIACRHRARGTDKRTPVKFAAPPLNLALH